MFIWYMMSKEYGKYKHLQVMVTKSPLMISQQVIVNLRNQIEKERIKENRTVCEESKKEFR